MLYTQAVIHETQRLANILRINVSRKTHKPTILAVSCFFSLRWQHYPFRVWPFLRTPLFTRIFTTFCGMILFSWIQKSSDLRDILQRMGRVWERWEVNPLFFLAVLFFSLMDLTEHFFQELVDHTIAFSLGKRACAGEALARVELFLALTATVQNYRILPMPGQTIDLTQQQKSIGLPIEQNLRIESVVWIELTVINTI